MEEQMRALTERLQQLQADNERLRAAGGAGASSSEDNTTGRDTPNTRGTVYERYVYVPRERKCPRFTGKTSEGLTVECWVEEMRRSLESRHMSITEQALFVYDHLDGEAKTEIKFRQTADKNDPERIFTILTEIYGCSQSYINLQKQFFQRRQLEGESLREYSHALLSLMELIKRKSSTLIPNPDQLVRDQFIEHVRDSMLRRELKRSVRLDPNVSFLTIRSEAIRWMEEGEHTGNPRTRAYSCDTRMEMVGECNMESQAVVTRPNNDLLEVKEALRKQQAQLDLLLKHLALNNTQLQPTGSVTNRPTRTYRYDPTGKPICIRCNQAGHIARFCRVGRGSDDGPRRSEQHANPQTVGRAVNLSEQQGNEFPLV